MIYYIKGNGWEKSFFIQPVEANSEEEALEIFTKTVNGHIKELEIEEVITDEARVMEIAAQGSDEDDQTTLH